MTEHIPGPTGGAAVKGLARQKAVDAMAMRAKCVDAHPCTFAGRLLPNDFADSTPAQTRQQLEQAPAH
jgi:hypothetical protein